LRNVVRISLILGTGETLSLADVSWLFDELQPLPQEKIGVNNSSFGKCDPLSTDPDGREELGGVPLEMVERRAILDTLRRTGGNQTKAAKVLGISDRTLRGKIHRYRQQGRMQLA
jgi:DNA-binding NtrC family response regulator